MILETADVPHMLLHAEFEVALGGADVGFPGGVALGAVHYNRGTTEVPIVTTLSGSILAVAVTGNKV